MPNVCTIIANGKSLNDVPVSFLDKYPTFGTNRIYLKYIPTYYVAINKLVIEQNLKDIEALPCEKFIRAGYGVGIPLYSSIGESFSFTPLQWVNEGFTVTYVCLQLALWFDTVLLVGLDHKYDYTGGSNVTQTMQEDDPNHFDPAYFKGQMWQTPDLKRSAKYYQVANEVYKGFGKRIINLTKDSACDVFEMGEIGEW